MTSALAWVLCLAFAPPAAMLALECLVGARGSGTARPEPPLPRPSSC